MHDCGDTASEASTSGPSLITAVIVTRGQSPFAAVVGGFTGEGCSVGTWQRPFGASSRVVAVVPNGRVSSSAGDVGRGRTAFETVSQAAAAAGRELRRSMRGRLPQPARERRGGRWEQLNDASTAIDTWTRARSIACYQCWMPQAAARSAHTPGSGEVVVWPGLSGGKRARAFTSSVPSPASRSRTQDTPSVTAAVLLCCSRCSPRPRLHRTAQHTALHFTSPSLRSTSARPPCPPSPLPPASPSTPAHHLPSASTTEAAAGHVLRPSPLTFPAIRHRPCCFAACQRPAAVLPSLTP